MLRKSLDNPVWNPSYYHKDGLNPLPVHEKLLDGRKDANEVIERLKNLKH